LFALLEIKLNLIEWLKLPNSCVILTQASNCNADHQFKSAEKGGISELSNKNI